MFPVLLVPGPVEHFYRGGGRIAALRGIVPGSGYQPEEWLGSTVTRFGEVETGLAVTAGGEFLRDLVVADPVAWTGGSGCDAGDTGVLVKLLDAGQRLPVHVHPSREFASAHLGCPYGKTEAWYVLDSVGDGAVYLGWNEDVDRDVLDRRRDAQDSEWLLSRMHRVPVVPGMGVLCPAGTVHAIGEGVFVAELQEPTDFSILLEWSVTTSTREESHLGLGFERVMPVVSTVALSAGDVEALVSRVGQGPVSEGPVSVLPAGADVFFRLLRARGSGVGGDGADGAGGAGGGVDSAGADGCGRSGVFPESFAVVLATEGEGWIVSGCGRVSLCRGEAYAIPRAFGAWWVEGPVTVLACLPGEGWPTTLTG
ncbi:MAG: carbohydrate kinase [Leucobacter sp.]